MKTRFRLLPVVWMSVLCTGVFIPHSLSAQVSPVTIQIEQIKKLGQPPRPWVISTNDMHMVITVKSVLGRAQPDLTLRYWLAIRDLTTKEITLSVIDSSALSLPPFGQQIVNTKEVESAFAMTHRDGMRTISDSGTKFFGYGIQILQADKVIKEVYEPPEMKAQIAGSANKGK